MAISVTITTPAKGSTVFGIVTIAWSKSGPAKSFQVRCLVNQRPDPLQDRIGCQRHRRAGIGGNRLDAGRRAVHPRRISRHRDHFGILTAEERRDEIQSGRVEEQGPLTLQVLRPQPGSDGPGLPVQLAVGQMDFLEFSVNQKRIGTVVRLTFCPLAQQVNQRGRSSSRIEESVFGMHGASNSGTRATCSTPTGRFPPPPHAARRTGTDCCA